MVASRGSSPEEEEQICKQVSNGRAKKGRKSEGNRQQREALRMKIMQKVHLKNPIGLKRHLIT